MEIESSVIETGVDKLVNIVKVRGRIALAEAAKEIGVSTTVIQEWVDFLEDEGIISVEYKLTKPYLVERKLSKKEIEVKEKEFTTKKDVFVRKAEVNLSFLEKQADELKKVKGEFDKLKSDMGLELDTVRSDLKELERYQQLKQELQKEIEEQKNEAKIRMEDLSRQILREKNRYEELVEDVSKERQELEKEKIETKSIEESESLLNEKLVGLKSMIGIIEKKVLDEDRSIKNSELHIEKLNLLVEDINSRVEEEKSSMEPLVIKSAEHGKKMKELQDGIMKKILQNQKNISDAENMTKKVKDFFEKKLAVANLVDSVNKDRDELEKSLIELIKKAKAFELTNKGGDIGAQMIELEKKFGEVDKKKTFFEKELKKLTSFFRR